ncbi:putative rhomboid protease RBD2 KNAG_0D00750 [Huiozyma naganishii CBS 8797]|uniref:Peptidase S54 rhomboid domain-containing protein n=1 Tax=Huiozyma naganishii (strain ATCC MYA-139 / BCRC 22969 / CBS 8797 / KCTC 17520 / NBRC 10181 / NCYC 3082 / Yp74L-3) TaxID=1071383 RepID=J7RXL1_HUIN7|nr:hypothetical protein KNAG_0D00750 [Kazachstania naganishii CBS 8797]CCK69827.1 hypothetical protein KNAG_0D00750 [Kazachstania naganishii CBS 8797]
MLYVDKFLRLYRRPFGALSAVCCTLLALNVVLGMITSWWTVDTAIHPLEFMGSYLEGSKGVFELVNEVSAYPFDNQHRSFVPTVLNLLLLFPALSNFERIHGTVHTFFFLNVITVAFFVPYFSLCVVSPSDLHIGGVTYWMQILWAYFLAKESKLGAKIRFFNTQLRIPLAWCVPLLVLVLEYILLEKFDSLDTMICVIVGFLVAACEKLVKLLLPPSFIIAKVETLLLGEGKNKTSRLGIKYYKAANVKRDKKYKSLFAEPPLLPKTKKAKLKRVRRQPAQST